MIEHFNFEGVGFKARYAFTDSSSNSGVKSLKKDRQINNFNKFKLIEKVRLKLFTRHLKYPTF